MRKKDSGKRELLDFNCTGWIKKPALEPGLETITTLEKTLALPKGQGNYPAALEAEIEGATSKEDLQKIDWCAYKMPAAGCKWILWSGITNKFNLNKMNCRFRLLSYYKI